MFDIEKENARLAAGGPKFSINPETEAAMHKEMYLQQVELQCYNSRCLFNKGNGKCGHIEPAISLRFLEKKDGGVLQQFVCWTTVEKSEPPKSLTD